MFYLSLVILTLGCIFSKQRLIFGILLFLCFRPNTSGVPIAVFHSSHKLKQECGQKVDFIEAHFNKRVENYLWLSKGIIGCGKKRFFFPSAVLKVPKHRFIGYPDQQIQITKVTIHQDNIHQDKTLFKPNLESQYCISLISKRKVEVLNKPIVLSWWILS